MFPHFGVKALHVLFEWPSWAGAVMGSVLVMLYCCAGGIRASIWTDAAQSAVMVMTMGLLLIVAVQLLGGTASAVAQMRQVDGFLDWFPTNTALLGLSGGVLFALSWLFAGLAVIRSTPYHGAFHDVEGQRENAPGKAMVLLLGVRI